MQLSALFIVSWYLSGLGRGIEYTFLSLDYSSLGTFVFPSHPIADWILISSGHWWAHCTLGDQSDCRDHQCSGEVADHWESRNWGWQCRCGGCYKKRNPSHEVSQQEVAREQSHSLLLHGRECRGHQAPNSEQACLVWSSTIGFVHKAESSETMNWHASFWRTFALNESNFSCLGFKRLCLSF